MINIDNLNSLIEKNIGKFWPQKNGNFFHEDNFKVALSNYFINNNILPYPEFSIKGGRIDLLGVDFENYHIYACEFKHCYIDVFQKIINDLSRLKEYDVIDEISDRQNIKFNKKTIIFIGGGMSETKLLFQSAGSDYEKKQLALEYMKKNNMENCEEKLDELHSYLLTEKSEFKFFENNSGANKYWTVFWISNITVP